MAITMAVDVDVAMDMDMDMDMVGMLMGICMVVVMDVGMGAWGKENGVWRRRGSNVQVELSTCKVQL